METHLGFMHDHLRNMFFLLEGKLENSFCQDLGGHANLAIGIPILFKPNHNNRLCGESAYNVT
jgi:hypothetical protein